MRKKTYPLIGGEYFHAKEKNWDRDKGMGTGNARAKRGRNDSRDRSASELGPVMGRHLRISWLNIPPQTG